MAKIMLVEDDNNLRGIYQDRLTAEGYTVITASDGEAALALAVKERPDLIIADIMMPKVSGFDMLDILRSTPETKNAKIIMMTALSQAEDKSRAEKLGADKYLIKSQVTLEDVVDVANQILNEQHATPDLASTGAVTSEPSVTPTSTNIAVATAPEPMTTATPTPAPPTEPDTIVSTTTDPSTPPVDESNMTEQIDSFIASNPTLSASADPAPVTTPQVATPAPMTDPQAVTASEPVVAPKTINVIDKNESEEATPTDTNTIQSNNAMAAVDGLVDEANGEKPSSSQDASKTPTTTYVSEGGGSQTDDSQSMKHTKRIEPTFDTVSNVPNINELLAREADHDDPTPPAVNSIITPGGGSFDAPTTEAAPIEDNTPQSPESPDNIAL